MTTSPEPQNPNQPLVRGGLGRELSPIAQHCALWLRFFARAVKTSRLYQGQSAAGAESRQMVWEQLTRILQDNGRWDLKITATDILLEDEVVVRQTPREQLEGGAIPGPEEVLPFLFYRDGVRGLTFLPKVSQREYDALFDALVAVGHGVSTQDDLVTILWQANLENLVVDSVPLEQTIYLSSRRPTQHERRGFRGQTFVINPSGSEIRGSLGALEGPQGLHRDTFDDWRLPDVVSNSVQAYQALLPHIDESRAGFEATWAREREIQWTELVGPMFRHVIDQLPADDTRRSLALAVSTWLADAIQRSEWEEATGALGLLRELDPDLTATRSRVAALLADLETEPIAEALDEANHDDHARFAGLIAALGEPAIVLGVDIMTMCTRARPRAAAVSALTYVCADEPRLLAPLLEDMRWFVVRNVVFVLGQIGGSEVVDLLRSVSQHPELRVRRELVRALGGVSRAERTPILIQQLTSRDPQLLAATLHMLTREKNERVHAAILARIANDEFDSLPEEAQRAFLSTLLDIAEESMIPALERLLFKLSGLFARRTLWREAAARTLFKIGTERAMEILQSGVHSKSEPVRAACLVALGSGKAAA